jgi:hypothetical protein
MMKLSSLLGVSLCVCVSISVSVKVYDDVTDRALEKEDEKLWGRLLQTDDLSVPIAPPMKKTTTMPVAPPFLPPVTTPAAPNRPPFSTPVVLPIPGPVACDVETTIDCVTSDGLPCNELQTPNPMCAIGSAVTAVTFGYSGNACNRTGNTQGQEAFCQDIAAINLSQTATVLCRDAEVLATGLVVEPPMIPIGGVFTVSAPNGSLPDKVDCILLDSAENQIQQVGIDTSGDVSLKLRDEFGAFTLLGCGESGMPGAQSCLDTLTYNIKISNVGSVELDVTAAEIISDTDMTISLLSGVDTTLSPGENIIIQSRQLIDLCTGEEYCAEVNVAAEPQNGGMCQDTDQYCFQISPLPPTPVALPVPTPVAPVAPKGRPPVVPPVRPPVIPPVQRPVTPPVKPAVKAPYSPPVPTPVAFPVVQPVRYETRTPLPPPVAETCVVELETTCVIGGNSSSTGKSCDTPSLGMGSCFQRPLQITMLYNGGDCSQSDNSQALKFTCADSNGGPPTTEGAMSYIVVTDIRGRGRTYFQGMVPVGSQYILGDGVNRVEADMFINIFAPDRATLLQAVQYHSSCASPPLELMDRFGASQIVQFLNKAQGNVTSFADFKFRLDVSVPMASGENITLKSLIANTNFAGRINLTNQIAGETVTPGGNVVVVLEGTIDASVRRMYVIMFVIEGTQNRSGEICTGMDTLSLEAGNAPDAPSYVTPTAPTSKSKNPKTPSSVPV